MLIKHVLYPTFFRAKVDHCHTTKPLSFHTFFLSTLQLSSDYVALYLLWNVWSSILHNFVLYFAFLLFWSVWWVYWRLNERLADTILVDLSTCMMSQFKSTATSCHRWWRFLQEVITCMLKLWTFQNTRYVLPKKKTTSEFCVLYDLQLRILFGR